MNSDSSQQLGYKADVGALHTCPSADGMDNAKYSNGVAEDPKKLIREYCKVGAKTAGWGEIIFDTPLSISSGVPSLVVLII